MDCNLPGSSVHEISQARRLEWVAISFSEDLPDRNQTLYLLHWLADSLPLRHQFCSVTQSYPTLWDPMDYNMPGLPVHHQLLELILTNVHRVSDAITISSSVVPFSSCPQSFPASGSFQMSQIFASGGQRIGVSDPASVLPMNNQDLFPLGRTGWISLQSKGL